MTGDSYDAAFPNIALELAAHPLFLWAYTDGTHAYSKGEIQAVLAAGVGIAANHENAANQLLGGTNAGHAAALAACAAVLAWGMPANRVCAIFYSVDVNVPTSQFAVIGQAFDAINAAHAGRFLVGVYGEGALIDYLASTGRIQVKGWLSASSSYPGYNRADGNVGAYQLVGTDVAGTDKDIVTNAGALGVWWPSGVAPLGSGELEDMALTTDEIAAIATAVWGSNVPTPGAASGGQPAYWVLNHLWGGSDAQTAALTAALGSLSALSQQVAALPTPTTGGTVEATVDMDAIKATLTSAVDAALANLNLVLSLGKATV